MDALTDTPLTQLAPASSQGISKDYSIAQGQKLYTDLISTNGYEENKQAIAHLARWLDKFIARANLNNQTDNPVTDWAATVIGAGTEPQKDLKTRIGLVMSGTANIGWHGICPDNLEEALKSDSAGSKFQQPIREILTSFAIHALLDSKTNLDPSLETKVIDDVIHQLYSEKRTLNNGEPTLYKKQSGISFIDSIKADENIRTGLLKLVEKRSRSVKPNERMYANIVKGLLSTDKDTALKENFLTALDSLEGLDFTETATTQLGYYSDQLFLFNRDQFSQEELDSLIPRLIKLDEQSFMAFNNRNYSNGNNERKKIAALVSKRAFETSLQALSLDHKGYANGLQRVATQFIPSSDYFRNHSTSYSLWFEKFVMHTPDLAEIKFSIDDNLDSWFRDELSLRLGGNIEKKELEKYCDPNLSSSIGDLHTFVCESMGNGYGYFKQFNDGNQLNDNSEARLNEIAQLMSINALLEPGVFKHSNKLEAKVLVNLANNLFDSYYRTAIWGPIRVGDDKASLCNSVLANDQVKVALKEKMQASLPLLDSMQDKLYILSALVLLNTTAFPISYGAPEKDIDKVNIDQDLRNEIIKTLADLDLAHSFNNNEDMKKNDSLEALLGTVSKIDFNATELAQLKFAVQRLNDQVNKSGSAYISHHFRHLDWKTRELRRSFPYSVGAQAPESFKPDYSLDIETVEFVDAPELIKQYAPDQAIIVIDPRDSDKERQSYNLVLHKNTSEDVKVLKILNPVGDCPNNEKPVKVAMDNIGMDYLQPRFFSSLDKLFNLVPNLEIPRILQVYHGYGTDSSYIGDFLKLPNDLKHPYLKSIPKRLATSDAKKETKNKPGWTNLKGVAWMSASSSPDTGYNGFPGQTNSINGKRTRTEWEPGAALYYARELLVQEGNKSKPS